MVNLIARFRSLVHDDKGQDLIEYALIAGLVSLVAVGAMTTAGEHVSTIWDNITASLADAAN